MQPSDTESKIVPNCAKVPKRGTIALALGTMGRVRASHVPFSALSRKAGPSWRLNACAPACEKFHNPIAALAQGA
jgi:hypothetical protein